MTNLLEVEGVKKHFRDYRFIFKSPRAAVALDGVNIAVPDGGTVGIVGESGCGKSTLVRCILGLEHPDVGKILFDGRDLRKLNRAEHKKIRAQIQPVFQDPASSLNPRRTVQEIITEPLIVHEKLSKKEVNRRVFEILELIGLQPEHATRYPSQLSGGQKQRVCIARALVLRPKLIIADEPTSALDVSVQAQILNLLRDLHSKLSLTILIISHNLAVIRNISDQVAIMYLGKLVEFGPTDEVFHNPKHPYTKALLLAIPKLNVRGNNGNEFELDENGEIPSAYNIPTGCRFHTRCSAVFDVCSRIDPLETNAHSSGYVACHLYSIGDNSGMKEANYE